MRISSYRFPLSPAEWSLLMDALDREDERLHQDHDTAPRPSPTRRAEMVRDLLHRLWEADLGGYYTEVTYLRDGRR